MNLTKRNILIGFLLVLNLSLLIQIIIIRITNNEFTSKFLKLSEYNELLENYLFHHLIQPDEPFDYKDNLNEINSNKFILLFDVKACKSCVLSQLIDIKDKYKLDPNNILLMSNFEDSNDFLEFLVLIKLKTF